MRQRSHHAGQPSVPFGSWRTSPVADALRKPAREVAGAVDLPPERLLVQVVGLDEARERVVLRLGAEQAARAPLARERPVEPAERLDPDEVAQDEHVERDLEPELLLDLRGRVAGTARLVVLDDPARAARVDVDPVDLPGERDAVAQVEAALQLRRRALRAEPDLEPARHERRLRARPRRGRAARDRGAGSARARAARARSSPSGRRRAHPRGRSQRNSSASSRLLSSTRSLPIAFGQPGVEPVQRRVRDRAAQHRVDLAVDLLRVRSGARRTRRRSSRRSARARSR